MTSVTRLPLDGWRTASTHGTVQRLLDHSNPRQVLKLYTRAADEALKAAATRTAESYWGGAHRELSECGTDGGGWQSGFMMEGSDERT